EGEPLALPLSEGAVAHASEREEPLPHSEGKDSWVSLESIVEWEPSAPSASTTPGNPCETTADCSSAAFGQVHPGLEGITRGLIGADPNTPQEWVEPSAILSLFALALAPLGAMTAFPCQAEEPELKRREARLELRHLSSK